MKILIAAIVLSATQLCSAADLTVQIDDVKSADGVLMLALYDAGSFLKKPLKAARAAAVPGNTTVVIKDLPEGEYAFALFHDTNGNGQMDKNPIGIPTEDYAFSNNALGTMGPPSFDSAKFALTAAGRTARVSLK
jgi:uncharacterized protein (DUF2141 family)